MSGIFYRLADAIRRRARGTDHGRMGEDLAHRFLRDHGCTVVARNYRTPSGSAELDLVAWEGETLVFVEVKTRASAAFGEPERAVDEEKQKHILRAAADYARRANIEWSRTRFDIVSIVLGRPVRIDWIREAFPH